MVISQKAHWDILDYVPFFKRLKNETTLNFKTYIKQRHHNFFVGQIGRMFTKHITEGCFWNKVINQ